MKSNPHLVATETRDGIEFGEFRPADRDTEARHLKAVGGVGVPDRAALLERLKRHKAVWVRQLAEKGGIDDVTRSVLAIASSVGVDRDREIVLPAAMGRAMPGFLATSSPMLSQHTHRTGDGRPGQIGWVMNGLVETGLSLVEMRYANPANAAAAAHEWWTLASDRSGKGVQFSIGFIPKQYAAGQVSDLRREYPEIADAAAEAGLADDARMLLWVEIELLEISSVAVGSNRQAAQVRSGEDLDAHVKAIAEAVSESVKAAVAGLAPADEKTMTGLRELLAEARSLTAELLELRDGLEERLPALDDEATSATRGPGRGRPARPDPGGDNDGSDNVQDAAARLARACGTDTD